jgi:hypothetical protein
MILLGIFYERLLVSGWLGWNLVYGKFYLGFNMFKIIDPLVSLRVNSGFAWECWFSNYDLLLDDF